MREAIRDNIADIIAEESIIGRDRDRIIKVPIRGVKEYRFIYGDKQPAWAKAATANRSPDMWSAKAKDGKGARQAGDRPGVDYYETDVTLDELIDIMFEDLELPDIERNDCVRSKSSDSSRTRAFAAKASACVSTKSARRALGSSARRRQSSIMSATAVPNAFPVPRGRSALHHTVTDTRKESNAVVLCIMDTSGSMDTMKKYLARSFFFLLYQFLCTKYQNVEIVFIAHHTEAREVTEEEFFHKGESGGTFISSGYNKALEIINERYHPALWNVYAFHCSDGDNFESDNEAALKAAQELTQTATCSAMARSSRWAPGYYGSSMITFFSQIQAANFQTVQIQKKEDIWASFKTFLSKDRAREDAA